MGAVNTQTVSTERGMFKEFSNLTPRGNDPNIINHLK